MTAPAATRVLRTPTGVLVTDAPPESPDWFAARREGLTATDVPKILGLSAYGNATSVWADKRGLLDFDEAGPAARWGHILEGPVAEEWAERHRTEVVTVGVLAHHELTWRRASLDRLVLVCPDGDGPCGLEVKTRSAWKGDQWRDDVPDDVLAQTTWQMLVAGYRHTHIACLIGGNDFRSYRVDLDPDVTALVEAEADRVWGHVQAGTPPADAPSPLLLSVLERLYPGREGTVDLPREQIDALLVNLSDAETALTRANRAAEDAKAVKKAAVAAIAQAVGGAAAGRYPSTTDGLLGDLAFVINRVEVGPSVQERRGFAYTTVKVPKGL